jgi:3-hydroxyisobutyrate dehydrogenase-like beta-hydroxyacid dehydrogenase
MRIGFVGLGDQGQPMAQRIAEAGLQLSVVARNPAQAAPIVERGAARLASLEELGAASDLLGICVGNDAEVREVSEGCLPGMEPGSILVIHSTVHPTTCRAVADSAASRGVAVVDAPVSGGRARAFAGTLTVMVGGDAADVERCRPVFDTFAGLIVHVGPLGSGEVLKLVNNLLFTAQVGITADAYELLGDLGLDVRASLAAIAVSTGSSRCIQMFAEGPGDHVFPRHSEGRARGAELLGKDVHLADEMLQERGVTVPTMLDSAIRSGLRVAITSGETND